MRRMAGFVVLALVVVACGGGGSTDDTDPPAAADPGSGPVAEGSYETLRQMQLAVEEAFILCNAPMKTYDPPTVEGALAQGDCKSDVNLHLFEPADIQTGIAALQAGAEGGVDLLVGDNWIIACSPGKGDCEKIQGIMGGELVAANP